MGKRFDSVIPFREPPWRDQSLVISWRGRRETQAGSRRFFLSDTDPAYELQLHVDSSGGKLACDRC